MFLSSEEALSDENGAIPGMYKRLLNSTSPCYGENLTKIQMIKKYNMKYIS